MKQGNRPPAACLIGWPAAHSRSPLIHHYWLRTLGIEGGYVIEAVPPDEFADFVLRLSVRGFVGANVTLPHKERALALSKPDERARAGGAAGEHHLARHERPARARARCRPAAVAGRGRRSRLRPAANTPACRRPGSWPADRRRARHAAASGGARFRALVRAATRGDIRT